MAQNCDASERTRGGSQLHTFKHAHYLLQTGSRLSATRHVKIAGVTLPSRITRDPTRPAVLPSEGEEWGMKLGKRAGAGQGEPFSRPEQQGHRHAQPAVALGRLSKSAGGG